MSCQYFSLSSPPPMKKLFLCWMYYSFLLWFFSFYVIVRMAFLFWGYKIVFPWFVQYFFIFTFLLLNLWSIWNPSWYKAWDMGTISFLERWLSSCLNIVCWIILSFPHRFQMTTLSFTRLPFVFWFISRFSTLVYWSVMCQYHITFLPRLYSMKI